MRSTTEISEDSTTVQLKKNQLKMNLDHGIDIWGFTKIH